MKVAIMQPYFLPYIGYYQLIGSVDLFVIYDNIKYTKKGWINRNRMLQNGADAMFSLPLKKGSDYADIRDRELSEDFNREKLLSQFKNAYLRAPQFAETMPILEKIVRQPDQNLFDYLRNSLLRVCTHLEIETEIVVSSRISIDHTLKSQDRVLALCEAIGADTYINAIGGVDLYDRDVFRSRNVELKFIQSRPIRYPQFGGEFVPWLSIMDVMMFNPRDYISTVLLEDFELL